MSQPLGGAGILLPVPAAQYPSPVPNAPPDISSNWMSLAPGNAIPIPAGVFFVMMGKVSVLQFYDPVAGAWRIAPNGNRAGWQRVKSDGYNFRIANLTGCPVAAVVTNAGSAYTSAPTVTPSSGTSTWQAVIGGQLSITAVSNAGVGYGLPPLVMIPAPPSPGIQATGYATLTSGTVSAVTLLNRGGGYTTAPTITLVPNPADPSLASITTTALATCALIGSGSIAGIICTNPGVAAGSTVPTLTISGGGGASGAATVLTMTTLTGATVYGAGAGYTGGAVLQTYGGISGATAVNTNPSIELADFIPRQASALLAAPAGASIASVSAIYDGGLYIGSATALVSPISGALQTTGASIAGIYGSANDTVAIQPAP